MIEYGREPGKAKIRAGTEKLSRRVSKMGRICVSTEKWWNPGEYRKMAESLRVSKTVPTSTGKGSNLCEYRKIMESGRVPEKNRILASIEKLSRQVPKNGRICESTEIW